RGRRDTPSPLSTIRRSGALCVGVRRELILRRLGDEVQAARSVRRECERLDPRPVDRRLPTAEVLEDEGAARVQPDGGASAADARILAPAERKGLPPTQLRGDDELHMSERPVLDLGLDRAVVNELAHGRDCAFCCRAPADVVDMRSSPPPDVLNIPRGGISLVPWASSSTETIPSRSSSRIGRSLISKW